MVPLTFAGKILRITYTYIVTSDCSKFRWSAHDERNSACQSRTTEKSETARDVPRPTTASLRSASPTPTALLPPAVRLVMVSVVRSRMIAVSVSHLPVVLVVMTGIVSRLVIVRLVMVSVSRSTTIVVSVSRLVIVRLVMVSVVRSRMIVVSVSRLLVVTTVIVSRLVIVRLVMVSVVRSRMTVVSVSRLLVVTTVIVSRLVIVRLVKVIGSRSTTIVVSVSHMPVVLAVTSVSRSARIPIAARHRTARSAAVTARSAATTGPTTARSAATTGPRARARDTAATRHPLPSVSTTPVTCGAPTVQTVSGRRKSMTTSQDRSWTRLPAPSCATSKRSTASGFPSTS